MSRSDIDPLLPKPLRRIYAEVPPGNCKGLCYEQCTSVPCTPIEHAEARRAGGEPPQTSNFCRFLDDAHRCSIYGSRPLVCRLYGTSKDPKLACPHGCKPALSAEKSSELVVRLAQLSPGVRSLDLRLDGLLLLAEERP